MKYLNTINHDLHGIKKLLMISNSNNYSSVAIHSLFRDSCLMLYEIIKVLENQGVLRESIAIYKKIEPIRHKVKSSQGKNNRNIFEKIIQKHIELFGDDIDNLGFYLEDGELRGSTLFVTYVFDETPFFNSINPKEEILKISEEIGRNVATIISTIQQPLLLPSNKVLSINEVKHEYKDVWHKRFFTEDIELNTCLMRLLIIQNEISSCLWIEKHLDYKATEFNLDKYLLIRLSSIKFYQIMESLIDIKDRIPQYYSSLGLSNLDKFLSSYTRDLRKEVKVLRDLLHYSDEQINFFEYVTGEIVKDNNYVEKLLQKILLEFFPSIQLNISDSLDISSIESMVNLEKIRRRISSKFKKNSKV
ncbi:hypothetical protein ACQKDD_15705 [Planococcus kocurii]|uniref:hypothetical protein n=1 Tax=Planococcus kocurii TaxID=1374 RepID=UPI003D0010DC